MEAGAINQGLGPTLMWKKSFVLGLAMVSLMGWFSSPWAARAEGMKAPREVVLRRTVREKPRSEGRGGLLRLGVRFFRTTLSAVDGDRCPMYPTCSQYDEEALVRHGALVGLLLAVDRLFHEWSETRMAPKVKVYGRIRYWDPLEENDFWFAPP
jgi:hypothetical protein